MERGKEGSGRTLSSPLWRCDPGRGRCLKNLAMMILMKNRLISNFEEVGIYDDHDDESTNIVC